MKAVLMASVVFFLLSSCSEDVEEVSVPEPCMTPGELSVVDSIGVEFGDSLYMFGSIEGLNVLDDGSIVFLDRAFSRVMIFDADGSFSRQIGREGDGPGEMSLTVTMAVTEGGDLLVSQRDAMERFDFLSGSWIAEYPRGMTPPPFVLAGLEDSSFVAVHFGIEPDDDVLLAKVTLGVYHPGSSEPETVLDEYEFEFLPTNASLLFENVFDGYCVAIDDSNTAYFARQSPDEYRVRGYTTSGGIVFDLIRNDLSAVEKTTEEMEEDREFMEARFVSMGAGEQECSPNRYFPMISGLGADGDGNIWVRRGGERIPAFDVYSPEGEYLREVTLPVSPDEGRFWNIIIDSGGFAAYSENPSSGYQKIYRLQLILEP